GNQCLGFIRGSTAVESQDMD
ncbi:hypothetical protein QTG54_013102, partial [Skeletonema marinoi]